MREIVDNVPIAWLVVVFVGLTLGVVVLAVWLIRRFVPATREGFDAEVSSQMLGVVAALFGLLLAFIIVIQYQNFGDAEGNVTQEADALAAIVRDSDAFRGPGGERVRLAIGTYVRAVVDDEWPRMREGEVSARAEDAVNGIYGALQAIEPRAGREAAFYDDAVRQLNEALVARRDRLEAASGGLPSLIAALIIVGSVVITGLRRSRRIPQLLVPRHRRGGDCAHRRLVARRAPRPQLPVRGKLRDRSGPVRHRSPRTVLRASAVATGCGLSDSRRAVRRPDRGPPGEDPRPRWRGCRPSSPTPS